MKEIKLSDIEEQMIWLEDPTKYEYVREGNYMCSSPNYKPVKKNQTYSFQDKGKLIKGKLKLIGYSKPKKTSDKSTRLYTGIYYYLKPYDIGMPYADTCYGDGRPSRPTEAVKIVWGDVEDGFPVIHTQPRDDGVEGHMFWCGFCNEFHLHGIGEGHRIAHCTNPNSPYREHGYVLKCP